MLVVKYLDYLHMESTGKYSLVWTALPMGLGSAGEIHQSQDMNQDGQGKGCSSSLIWRMFILDSPLLPEPPDSRSFICSLIQTTCFEAVLCARHWSYNSEPKIRHPFIYRLVSKKER